MQHMKNRHGLKKFKCNFCDYRSNDRKTLKGHENNKHNHELFKCLQCEYRSARKDMLKRHIQAIHVEKNIRCRTPSKIHCFFSFYIENFKSLLDKQVNIGQKANDFPMVSQAEN